jgi:hypothetical protein
MIINQVVAQSKFIFGPQKNKQRGRQFDMPALVYCQNRRITSNFVTPNSGGEKNKTTTV